MGKKKYKRKYSSGTGSELGVTQVTNPTKNPRNDSSPTFDLSKSNGINNEDLISVSDTLRRANSVLFSDSELHSCALDLSVFGTPTATPSTPSSGTADRQVTMADVGTKQSTAGQPPAAAPWSQSPGAAVPTPQIPVLPDVAAEKGFPTEAIILYLQRIELKINNMDVRLNALDKLDQKVSKLEIDLNKLYSFVHDQNKKLDCKVSDISDKVDALEFALGTTQSELCTMREADIKTREELIYLKSQSMRNNLVFGNIPEQTAETWEQSEEKLRLFLNEKMKIAMDQVNAIKFERVHRMGNFSQNSAHPRKLVAKFVYFKDREYVRRQRENLHDTDYFLHEQFPPEVAARRRAHIPALKSARRQGRRAWLSYDTLYVDGRPVSDDDAATTAGGRAT